MKDKELREIVYNACNEFDQKLEFIYEQLKKIEEYGGIDIPKNVFLDHTNPFKKASWFVFRHPNWRQDLKKTKCKEES